MEVQKVKIYEKIIFVGILIFFFFGFFVRVGVEAFLFFLVVRIYSNLKLLVQHW